MAAGWIYPDEPDRRVGELGGGASGAGDNNGTSAKWWAGELGRETLEQIVRAIRSVVYGHSEPYPASQLIRWTSPVSSKVGKNHILLIAEV